MGKLKNKVVRAKEWIDDWVQDESDRKKMLYAFRKKFPGHEFDKLYNQYINDKFGVTEAMDDYERDDHDYSAYKPGKEVDDSDIEYTIDRALDNVEYWFEKEEGKEKFEQWLDMEDPDEKQGFLEDDILADISLQVEQTLWNEIHVDYVEFSVEEALEWFKKWTKKKGYDLDFEENTLTNLEEMFNLNEIAPVLGIAARAAGAAAGTYAAKKGISKIAKTLDKEEDLEEDNADELMGSGAWNKAEKHTKYDPPKTGNSNVSARKGFVG